MGRFGFLKEAFASYNLTRDEELELVKQYQNGDQVAYRKLRKSLRPLVEDAINDVMPNRDGSVSVSNLRLRADAAIPGALQKFDTSRDIKLNTYLKSIIKGHLRNAKKENTPGPYVPRNQHYDLERFRQAYRDAEMEYGKNPTEEQTREFFPHDEATKTFDEIKPYHVVSLYGDAVYGDDDDNTGVLFKDQFTDFEENTEDDLYASLYDDEEDQLIKKNFDLSEQEIIKRVNKDGQTFVQVALGLGVSTADVRKTLRKWHSLTQTH